MFLDIPAGPAPAQHTVRLEPKATVPYRARIELAASQQENGVELDRDLGDDLGCRTAGGDESGGGLHDGEQRPVYGDRAITASRGGRRLARRAAGHLHEHRGLHVGLIRDARPSIGRGENRSNHHATPIAARRPASLSPSAATAATTTRRPNAASVAAIVARTGMITAHAARGAIKAAVRATAARRRFGNPFTWPLPASSDVVDDCGYIGALAG
ncbi:hypothetical protein KDL01_06820 [Actinospica durhamensis]|uniref:Uncharacterized protein n=1 Tax=Actinospica durhamensis TaxID=1508375 RepID=A0A941EJZ8_9ACTN|nr:hypothetical protein [Actinospica durhamensis]MBR7832967.1 hypothetical protein [Actinospica durhamensis]